MSLSPGATLGSFEISGLIGVGGMGEVYRARDTKLGREVAIKVLPEAFAKDSERLARFEREAKLLAALNHPNIAGIHELGNEGETHFLVMELVDGTAMDDRLRSGAMSVEEALPLFAQIAEALENAHEQGIVHRDLKPANIKVTNDGKVKVLDFGLAKAFEAEGSASTPGHTLTLGTDPSNITAEGRVLGTPAYMSPEQARGRSVDKRADIWGYGCCLYEALTGKRPFGGETASDLLADILKGEPDWEALPDETPTRVRVLLWRCLQKDPQRRLRDIGDARLELDESGTDPSGAFAAPSATLAETGIGRGRAALLAISALLVGGLLAAAAVWSLTRPKSQPIARLFIAPPEGQALRITDDNPDVAISPDDQRIVVYVGGEPGDAARLYLRPLGSLEATAIPGTENAINPFFSPDGETVGFFDGQNMKKGSIHGGGVVAICPASMPRGASWGPDDTIIFTDLDRHNGLLRVPAAGGEPEILTTPEVGTSHRWPEILPGGEAVLFTVWSGAPDQAHIEALSLETLERHSLVPGGNNAHYATSGHIVYGSAGNLMAAPFDPKGLKITGPPASIVSGVMMKTLGCVNFALAGDGSLVYLPGAVGDIERQLVWVDRQGVEEPLPEDAGDFVNLALSPDGKGLAVLRIEAGNIDIWVGDLDRGGFDRFTYDADIDVSPTWSPDGAWIAFGSARNGVLNLYRRRADSSGEPERLWESDRIQVPHSWSPDGKFLLFVTQRPGTGADIAVLSLEGDEPAVELLLDSEFGENSPRISPDGRWFAYQSNASGRDEVYVEAFPDLGGREKISIGGGIKPLWAPSGKEIFYWNNGQMMSVTIETEPEFRAGRPQVLFEGEYYFGGPGAKYDISPDAERFIMIKDLSALTETTQMIVVLNWFEELKRLAPTDK